MGGQVARYVVVLTAMLACGALSGGSVPIAGPPHEVCGDCHSRGEAATGVETPQPGEGSAICLRCHTGSSDRKGAGGTLHGGSSIPGETVTPPMGGDRIEALTCLSCHDPHARGTPRLLRHRPEADSVDIPAGADPVSAFCIGCHPLTGEFTGSGGGYSRHPIGVRARSVAPGRDGARGGELVGCTTCHEVHSSPNDYLMRWSPAESRVACVRCHDLDPTRASR